MSYLALAKKIQAELKSAAGKPEPRGTVDMLIDDRTVAVLIDSTILGAPLVCF